MSTQALYSSPPIIDGMKHSGCHPARATQSGVSQAAGTGAHKHSNATRYLRGLRTLYSARDVDCEIPITDEKGLREAVRTVCQRSSARAFPSYSNA